MMLSLDTAYRSFGGEVEASSTPTICRLPDSRRHQLWAIARHRPPESLLFAEFCKKFFDMTYIGSTRVVNQASAHSLPLTVAGRHIALNPTDSTHGYRNPLDLNSPF